MAATILMADDNPVNLAVLQALLGKEGYELIAADSGQAALDLVRANPGFDLVLLDVVMPDMDGVEVCRRLKSDPKTAHIPVVLLSGLRTETDNIQQGLTAGADGYLTKPIDDTALRAWVKATLRISALERRLAACGDPASATAKDVRRALADLPAAIRSALEALYADADILALELQQDTKALDLVNDIKTQAERIATLVTEASQKAGPASGAPGRQT